MKYYHVIKELLRDLRFFLKSFYFFQSHSPLCIAKTHLGTSLENSANHLQSNF